MTTRTYRCFRCWTTILLILVAAYEASHLVAMGGADKRSGLIFLGLLVAAFLTVGLSSEILIEGSPIRFAFYLAAIGLFLYTSLAENRTRLTRRIQRVQSGERLKTTLQDVRNRASVLLEQAIAEQDARQPKAAAAKENIEAQIPHFKELRSELIAARNECPPNDERVATAEQDFQEARRRLRPYLVEQRTQNARLQVLKQVIAGAQKVMRPFEK